MTGVFRRKWIGISAEFFEKFVTVIRPISERRGWGSFSAQILILRSEGGAAEPVAFGRVRLRCAAFATGDCFIPCSDAGCKFDPEWLPRCCPACGAIAVVGHGRRARQAHDRASARIRVRRGVCTQCARTITVLPPYCIPRAVYNLPASAKDKPVRLLLRRLVRVRSLSEKLTTAETKTENRLGLAGYVTDVCGVRDFLGRRPYIIENLDR